MKMLTLSAAFCFAALGLFAQVGGRRDCPAVGRW